MLAPLALVQLALPRLADGARIVNLSSDAAVEAYETWGGYGSSKAALAQITAVLGAENPGLRAYAVDPGDMRTQMQQEAFPGEDISDRPPPEESVPGLLRADRGRRCRAASTAPASSSGPRHERARDRPARSARGARAARGARPAARRRAPARRRAGRTARSSTAAFATCRSSSRPATSSSSTRPPRLPAALPATRADGERARAPALDAAPRARIPSGSGSSSCAAAMRRSDASRSASSFELPGGGTARDPRALRRRPAVARASRPAACRFSVYLAEHGQPDPLRLRPARAGRSRRTRTSTRSSPAAPRCRAPAGRSRPS